MLTTTLPEWTTFSFFLSATVALFTLVVYYYYYFIRRKEIANQPPEAKGWPIVGYVPNLYPRAYKGFMLIKKQHQHVATVRIGLQKFIILLSYPALKEALITKGENFSGRMTNPIRDRESSKAGLLFIDGPLWKEHRRFSLRVLRDFGFGRNVSETIVYNETQLLLDYIEKKVNDKNGINTLDLLLRSVSNVICTLTMGEQPGYEDEIFGDLVNRMRSNLANSLFKSLFIMFPFLAKFTALAYVMPTTKQQFKNIIFIESYIGEKIKKCMNNFDESHEPNNFIEAFLLEQHKLDKQNVKNHTFTEKQLLRLIFELFIAGTDTTSNSLAWGILMLALYPDVQKRCHEEIDSVIGRERPPTMKDKQNTPYISAVLDEVQRYTTLVPMSLLHRSLEKDTIMGYNIPANSFVIPFIYGIHHDPSVWEKPNEFYPKHFLSNDEKTYKPREELIPFSLGKRICLGESLAKVELYIFFVSLVQKYNLKLHENDLNRLDEVLLGSEGIIHSPDEHHIIFTHRN